jgi:hypothetical protein
VEGQNARWACPAGKCLVGKLRQGLALGREDPAQPGNLKHQVGERLTRRRARRSCGLVDSTLSRNPVPPATASRTGWEIAGARCQVRVEAMSALGSETNEGIPCSTSGTGAIGLPLPEAVHATGVQPEDPSRVIVGHLSQSVLQALDDAGI